MLERTEKNLTRNASFQDRALRLFQSAFQSVSLSWVLSESPPVQRADLAASLETMRDSETVTAPLKGTPFAAQARQEWEDVLASPFSPIPMLEDALSREWKELPTHPEGIARLFEKALTELEKRS